MNRIQSTLSKAEGLVTPSASEEARVARLAANLLARTKTYAARFPETRGVVIGGSYAKGTWLPGHVDIDVFV